MLYELLTGTRPTSRRGDSGGALEDAILQRRAAAAERRGRSDRSASTLRGDLDTIVLKALKKKPEERYATVNAFADDVERYLEAVRCSPSRTRACYRLAKFVGRNRLSVGAVRGGPAGGARSAPAVAVWQARRGAGRAASGRRR